MDCFFLNNTYHKQHKILLLEFNKFDIFMTLSKFDMEMNRYKNQDELLLKVQ